MESYSINLHRVSHEKSEPIKIKAEKNPLDENVHRTATSNLSSSPSKSPSKPYPLAPIHFARIEKTEDEKDPEAVKPKDTIPKEMMELARKVAWPNYEKLLTITKQVPKEAVDALKKLNAPKPDESPKEAGARRVLVNSALYHAWNEIQAEYRTPSPEYTRKYGRMADSLREKDPNRIPNGIRTQKENYVTAIVTSLKRNNNAEYKPQCYGNGDPIVSNVEPKFSCISNDLAFLDAEKNTNDKMEKSEVGPTTPMDLKELKERLSAIPSYRAITKSNMASQKWMTSGLANLVKETKNRLWKELKNLTTKILKGDEKRVGLCSTEKKETLGEFEAQLEKIQNSKEGEFSIHLDVLNETHRLLKRCKEEGYSTSAKGFGLIFLEFIRGQNEGVKPLSEFGEEYQTSTLKEKETMESKAVLTDCEVRGRLTAYLEKVVLFLREDLKKTVENERVERAKFSHHDLSTLTETVGIYFKKLIKIHKNFSFGRFLNLPRTHADFVNRILYILSKFENEEQRKAMREIASNILSPKILLLETEKHRVTQGQHDRGVIRREIEDKKSEKLEKVDGDNNNNNAPKKTSLSQKKVIKIRDDKKHKRLEALKAPVSLVMMGPYDMNASESAHQLFPTLFAPRYKDEDNKPILNEKNNLNAGITSAYYLSDSEKKKIMFRSDVDYLFKSCKEGNYANFVESATELALRTAFEESSHTAHVPSPLNQKVDASSEVKNPKFVKDDEVVRLFKQLKTLNQAVVEKNKKLNIESSKSEEVVKDEKKTLLPEKGPYTDKVYKYVLAVDLFRMIQKVEKEVSVRDMMEAERNYLSAVKRNLADAILKMTRRKKNAMNLFIAICLANQIGALKNAEAKEKCDFTEGEKKLEESIKALNKWIGSGKETEELSFADVFEGK